MYKADFFFSVSVQNAGSYDTGPTSCIWLTPIELLWNEYQAKCLGGPLYEDEALVWDSKLSLVIPMLLSSLRAQFKQVWKESWLDMMAHPIVPTLRGLRKVETEFSTYWVQSQTGLLSKTLSRRKTVAQLLPPLKRKHPPSPLLPVTGSDHLADTFLNMYCANHHSYLSNSASGRQCVSHHFTTNWGCDTNLAFSSWTLYPCLIALSQLDSGFKLKGFLNLPKWLQRPV